MVSPWPEDDMRPSWISTRAAVAAAALLFALVYALQLAGGTEHDIFATLYVLPILVLGLALGRWGGLLGAAVGMVLIASRLALQEVELPAVRFGVRSLVLVVLGYTAGVLAERLRESNALLGAVVEAATDGIFVKDAQGRYLLINRAAAALLGKEPADFLGRIDVELMGREAAARSVASDAEAMRSDVPHSSDEALRVDGRERVFWVSKSPLRSRQGQVVGVVVVARDATERTRQATALVAAHQRFRRALEESPIGVGVMDLSGRLIEVNAALAELLGREADEVVGQNELAFTHPADVPMCERSFAMLRDGATESLHMEKRFIDAAGHAVWVHLSMALIRDERGAPAQLLTQVLDVTERQRNQDLLAHQALHDSLTGLPNRSLLLERIEHALQRRQRDDRNLVALIFIDLDRFKPINDTLGHSVGDAVLVEVARRLQGLVRAGDTVARLGGDEFTILAEDLESEADAHDVAGRIFEAVAQPFQVSGREVFVGASIGIAYARPRAAVGAETLLRDADTAMYEAKRTGRRVVVHTDALRAIGQHRLDVESGLREALQHDGFEIEYQPQIDLRTDRPVGVEALVRWRRPDGEIALPGTFIPLAEETGLIVPLGQLVLDRACAAAAAWGKATGASAVRLAVNLSARQFGDAALLHRIEGALRDNDLQPDQLELEITESVLMRDAELTLSTLRALKAVGVHVAVDDFGTGYSSLAYLQRFPVDRVKIDRSFVSTMHSGASASTRLVEAIVSMAHALGMDVVAEGVEDCHQLEILRSVGVDVGQGYLLGRPQAAEQVLSRLASASAAPSR